MKRKTEQTIYYFLIMFLVASSIGVSVYVVYVVETVLLPMREVVLLLQNGRRYVLYDYVNNQTISEQTKLLGVYNPSTDIYCMYYDHPNISKQLETQCHEYCHAIIDSEGKQCYTTFGNGITCKDHFCK